MDRKTIQEQRIKGYFLAATREILKGEGLKSLSVRNIAERAGYSFATLYNYFKDLKELVFLCVQDFQQECSDYVQQKTGRQPAGTRKLKAIVLAYLEYFVQYPGVFELFFLEKAAEVNGQQDTAALIVSFLDHLCAAEWQYCLDKKIYTPAAMRRIKTALLAGTTGLLLLYLNRKTPGTYQAFIKQAGQYIDDQLQTT